MKKLIPFFMILLIVAACQKPDTSSQETVATDSVTVTEDSPDTYAEIAVRTGGTWNDRVYENGGPFENVEFLRVPDEHTDHSFYIRYEGPGWESSKVGYRLYLDWRNATDIFGKITSEMVLSEVGQDGFDSYHEPGTWGMDILKVGSSLGIGSIGRLVDNQVMHFEKVDSTTAEIENSDSESSVTVNYYGWQTGSEKIDLTSEYSIGPNVRYTEHTVKTSKAVEGLSTGIVKHDSTNTLTGTSPNGEWAYLATYGVQTLVPDKLGMAIFYPTDVTADVKEAEFDHLITFEPTTDEITFYFLGAWEQETDGIKTEEAFRVYLEGLLETLNSEGEL